MGKKRLQKYKDKQNKYYDKVLESKKRTYSKVRKNIQKKRSTLNLSEKKAQRLKNREDWNRFVNKELVENYVNSNRSKIKKMGYDDMTKEQKAVVKQLIADVAISTAGVALSAVTGAPFGFIYARSPQHARETTRWDSKKKTSK